MAPERIIIDTDPGIDDILALLLAFSASPEEVEVLLVSVTFGNVEVHDCLRNVVALFHIINREQEWRRSQSRPDGFDALNTFRPIVSVGVEEPLADQLMMADFYHGKDGLGNIHSSHPHLSPVDTWKRLFNTPPSMPDPSDKLDTGKIEESTKQHPSFTPSKLPSYLEMLRMLKENPKDSITIVALGPLTNLAMAAAEDPETFLRVKDVVVMGGAIEVPGNITPTAEFNFCADAFAAARVLALTSPNPPSTMPPTPSSHLKETHLKPYPPRLSRQLSLTLCALDITTAHLLTPTTFETYSAGPLRDGSPLAEWVTAFLAPTFGKPENEQGGALSLHDPLAVWCAIKSRVEDGWKVEPGMDVRVEAGGQWTRGFCVVDRRGRGRRVEDPDVDVQGHVSGDSGGWLSDRRGNRVGNLTRTPVMEGVFGEVLCQRLFGMAAT